MMWEPNLSGILTILIGLAGCARAASLRCYNRTLDSYVVTPLGDPVPLTSCIDPELPTVFYTFGYRGRANGPATTAVLNAYLSTKKRNVILLDWEDEAKSGLLGITLGYAFSAIPNAKKIGGRLGDALVTLARNGFNTSKSHLIGHSLGAHVMAFAGRRARKEGHVLIRITGLDPARALFEGTFAMNSGLDRTCARFVDIVHSDPGGYGTIQATGSVDFWPNYIGERSIQPGCPSGQYDMFSLEDLCSHDRSWKYFVESISSPTAFLATAAKDYNAWISNDDHSNNIYMGDLTSMRARGNFFLTTNSNSPHGKGKDGLKPANISSAR